MTWTNNKTLQEYNKYTPCKAIFQGVCDEIGAYYVVKGFKYSASRPKLVFKKDDFTIEIAFFSSRNNTPGQYINLEIIPTLTAKSAKTEENPKGVLSQYPDLFYDPSKEIPPKMTIHEIYEGVIYNTESWITESVIRDYHACDVYGLDEAKFLKIIAFIDHKILAKFDEIIDKHKISNK
jgi:hypothetical protein